jgi:hypothetical protein
LPCARQNLLFNYFAATLAAEIRAAKAEGRYFEGMSELAGVPKLKQVPIARPVQCSVARHLHCMLLFRGLDALWCALTCLLDAQGVHRSCDGKLDASECGATVQDPDVVWTDRTSGLQTLRNILQVDRGMSYGVCICDCAHLPLLP